MEPLKCTVHKLDERTYCIDQFDVHLYLFLGREWALLWDTGFDVFPDLRETVNRLTDLPVMVVNSHGHPDHSGSNLQFEEIYAHPDGFDMVRTYQGGDGSLKPLRDGQVIDLGGRSFQVIHTPGHQRGHISLLNRTERTLLPGDVIQGEHVIMYLPGSNWDEYRASLARLKELGDAYDTILPSHGAIPLGKEQIDKIIAAADAYRAGTLTGHAAVGPDGSPCKEYVLDGFSILDT